MPSVLKIYNIVKVVGMSVWILASYIMNGWSMYLSKIPDGRLEILFYDQASYLNRYIVNRQNEYKLLNAFR